jgi:DNA topoisomerase 2-associated protein PAT1
MSFFGFDASIPPDASLDAKIEALRHAAGEDVAVYDFGAEEPSEAYDGLGDRLDESANELNDETFGRDDIGACVC